MTRALQHGLTEPGLQATHSWNFLGYSPNKLCTSENHGCTAHCDTAHCTALFCFHILLLIYDFNF